MLGTCCGFGGNLTHYQLAEEESGFGETELVLRVHPQVGAVLEAEVIDVLLTTLGGGRAINRFMERQIRSSVNIHVKRIPPLMTRSCKILHIHAQPRD